MRRTLSLARALGFELACWCALALPFLGVYLHLQGVGSSAAIAHLDLLLAAWLALLSFRLALRRVVPSEPVSRWLCAFLLAAAALVLVTYYALVLVGLLAWNRVITWQLALNYAGQLGELAETLQLPLWASVAWPAGLAGFTWALARRPLRHDAATLAAAWPRRMVAVALVALPLAAAVRVYDFLAWPPVNVGEPVSLSFFPSQRQSGLGAILASPRSRADSLARAAYQPGSDVRRRNVILIVADCLRADHMGIYGYARPTTPFLAEAARAGRLVLAPPLQAVCSESICGLMGILRSRFVHEYTNEAISLADVFRQHGYAIHLLMGGDHTSYYGLKEAYGRVDSYFDGSMAGRNPNDDEVLLERTRALQPWNGRPQLFQFHLMSTHGLGKRRAGSDIWRPVRHPYGFLLLAGRSDLPEVVNYYDNGVRQFDDVVRELLAEMGTKGYLSDALVVITGDHGEMLGDHAISGHGSSVHEGALRVPLVLLRYGYRAAGRPRWVTAGSQVDVAPTILRELGMPLPSGWSGQPLQDRSFRRDFTFFQQGALVGLTDHRHSPRVLKYWRDMKRGREVAYDIATDPRELQDLFATLPPGLKAEWRQLLLPAASAVKTLP